MDPLGISKSFSGSTHILLTLLTFFYITVALVLFGYAFKKNKHFLILSTYSFEISLIILAAGFLTGISAIFSMPSYVGFFEKLPVASFMAWIILTSFFVIRSDRRIKYMKYTNAKKLKRN